MTLTSAHAVLNETRKCDLRIIWRVKITNGCDYFKLYAVNMKMRNQNWCWARPSQWDVYIPYHHPRQKPFWDKGHTHTYTIKKQSKNSWASSGNKASKPFSVKAADFRREQCYLWHLKICSSSCRQDNHGREMAFYHQMGIMNK